MRFTYFLNFLVLFIFLFLFGCATKPKMSASIGLAYQLDNVSDINHKAIKKLEDLEKKGKLDPESIASRLDISSQEISRLRGALTLRPSSSETPGTPSLPEGDKSALASPTFSDTGNAALLLSAIKLSPFEIISKTRDIYETLIPAHLRFGFDSLSGKGYRFYYFPITLTAEPGNRMKGKYIADFNFKLEDISNANPSVSYNKLEYDQTVANSSDHRDRVCTPKSYEEVNDEIKSLNYDVKIFSISPLRQFDSWAESIARRIQDEKAFLLSKEWVRENTSAAFQSAWDNLRRLESDFATISQQPIMTGRIDTATIKPQFGWKVYPSFKKGVRKRWWWPEDKKEEYDFKPGPRDAVVIIAVKPKPTSEQAEILNKIGLPSFKIPIKWEGKWIRASYSIFAKNEKPSECSKKIYLVIPGSPPQANLTADLKSANNTLDLKSGPKLITITGSGFSKKTRAIINNKKIAPSGITPNKATFPITPQDVPRKDEATPYTITITDGPKRVTLVKDPINIKNPKKLEVKYASPPASPVTPGTVIKLKYTGPPPKDTGSLAKFSPTIALAGQTVPTIIFDSKKHIFGFIVPSNIPNIQRGPLTTIVDVGGKKHIVEPNLFYDASLVNHPDDQIRVKVK